MDSSGRQSDFELSPTDKQDHVPVLYGIDVRVAAAKCADVCARETCQKAVIKSQASRLKLDKDLLQDPYKVELFQRGITKLHAKLSARFDVSVPSSIDAVLSEWNTQVAIISRAIFSPPRIGVPKKSWISPWSWSIIRIIAPIRRIIFKCKANMSRSSTPGIMILV